MAELIYHAAVTLDRFIADTKGNPDPSIFLYEGDHATDFLAEIRQYDAVLMGGNTYAYGFQFGMKPGQPAYQGLKHYVFSKSLQFESNQDVELVPDDAASYVAELKKKSDGPLWLCGGGQLAGTLLQHRLIDQLILKINPVWLGEGIPLFGDKKLRLNLELRDMKTYSNGVVKAVYAILHEFGGERGHQPRP